MTGVKEIQNRKVVTFYLSLALKLLHLSNIILCLCELYKYRKSKLYSCPYYLDGQSVGSALWLLAWKRVEMTFCIKVCNTAVLGERPHQYLKTCATAQNSALPRSTVACSIKPTAAWGKGKVTELGADWSHNIMVSQTKQNFKWVWI